MHPDSLVDATEERLDPGGQRDLRQAPGPLEVKHGDEIAADRLGGVHEVICLGDRIVYPGARLRKVIGTDVEACSSRLRTVGDVGVVDEIDVLARLHEGELLA